MRRSRELSARTSEIKFNKICPKQKTNHEKVKLIEESSRRYDRHIILPRVIIQSRQLTNSQCNLLNLLLEMAAVFPDGCIGFVVLLAVLAVNDTDLLANFVLHFGQQKRVGVGHDGTLLQACERRIPFRSSVLQGLFCHLVLQMCTTTGELFD